MLSKDEKKALQVGLQLRDQLGGHHFLQAEVGGARWLCRDCGLVAAVDPRVWQNWWQLFCAVTDPVRAILARRDCPALETDIL